MVPVFSRSRISSVVMRKPEITKNTRTPVLAYQGGKCHEYEKWLRRTVAIEKARRPSSDGMRQDDIRMPMGSKEEFVETSSSW